MSNADNQDNVYNKNSFEQDVLKDQPEWYYTVFIADSCTSWNKQEIIMDESSVANAATAVQALERLVLQSRHFGKKAGDIQCMIYGSFIYFHYMFVYAVWFFNESISTLFQIKLIHFK